MSVQAGPSTRRSSHDHRVKEKNFIRVLGLLASRAIVKQVRRLGGSIVVVVRRGNKPVLIRRRRFDTRLSESFNRNDRTKDMSDYSSVNFLDNPEGLLQPNELDKFQRTSARVMKRLISEGRYRPLWKLFLAAYKFRSGYSYLEESGRDGDGLTYALRHALETYVVPVERSHAYRNASDEVHDAQISLDPKTFEHLLRRLPDVADRVVKNQTTLVLFAHTLWYQEINVETISDDKLCEYFVQALERYYKRRKIGLSSDPL